MVILGLWIANKIIAIIKKERLKWVGCDLRQPFLQRRFSPTENLEDDNESNEVT